VIDCKTTSTYCTHCQNNTAITNTTKYTVKHTCNAWLEQRRVVLACLFYIKMIPRNKKLVTITICKKSKVTILQARVSPSRSFGDCCGIFWQTGYPSWHPISNIKYCTVLKHHLWTGQQFNTLLIALRQATCQQPSQSCSHVPCHGWQTVQFCNGQNSEIAVKWCCHISSDVCFRHITSDKNTMIS